MRGIVVERAADLSEEMSHRLFCIHSLLYRGHSVSKSMREEGAVGKGFRRTRRYVCRQKDVLFDSQRSPTLLVVPLQTMPKHSIVATVFRDSRDAPESVCYAASRIYGSFFRVSTRGDSAQSLLMLTRCTMLLVKSIYI